MKNVLCIVVCFITCSIYCNAQKQISHTAIDLGLSVKWASTNLGANSSISFGKTFIWGYPTPATDYFIDNQALNDPSLSNEGSGTLPYKYDAANFSWKNQWRMPTENEFGELLEKCTWKWVVSKTKQGKIYSGYKVTGPNGNSIFLPAKRCRCKGEHEDCNVLYLTSTYSVSSSGRLGCSYVSVADYDKAKKYDLPILLGYVRPVTK